MADQVKMKVTSAAAVSRALTRAGFVRARQSADGGNVSGFVVNTELDGIAVWHRAHSSRALKQRDQLLREYVIALEEAQFTIQRVSAMCVYVSSIRTTV